MDLPEIMSWKFGYADDWAIVTQSSNFEALETTLSEDITLLANYFKRWYLNMNESKTVARGHETNLGSSQVHPAQLAAVHDQH